MLASRIAALTIATGALAAAASPAFASVEVNPNPVSPGGAVWVHDSFRDMACPSTDTWAIAKSEGFKGDTIKLTRDDNDEKLTGSGWAIERPGSYSVKIFCASGKPVDQDDYTLVISAKGAPHTGDGASILGSGTGEGTGLALLGGALAIGAVVVRRKVKADR